MSCKENPHEAQNLAAKVEKYLCENKIVYIKEEKFFADFDKKLSFSFIGSPFLISFKEKEISVFSRAVTRHGSGFRTMSPETFLAFFEHLKS